MVELGTTSQEEGNQPTGREVPLPLSLEGNLALIVGESLVVRGQGRESTTNFPTKTKSNIQKIHKDSKNNFKTKKNKNKTKKQ